MTLRRELETGPRPPLLRRLTPSQLLAVDLLLACFLLLMSGWHGARAPGSAAAATTAAGVLVGVGIALRRRSPPVALVLMVVAVAVSFETPTLVVPSLAFALPVYSMAATRPRARSVPVLVALTLVLVGLGVAAATAHRGSLAAGIVLAGAAWAIGDSVRVRRHYVDGLAEQAAQRESEALERAERSVAEERLEIARELHDVVAHSLSVIALQSGVGRHVIDANPTEAKRALGIVEETSRAALDELRRMLGILRRPEAGSAPHAPAPGVELLPQLIEQVRRAGVRVDLFLAGATAERLTPSAGLSVYRIVQEALTNVVKHAPGARACVEVREEHDDLVLEVVDDGRPGVAPDPDSAGAAPVAHHGLVGMRERVTLFGGSFSAGPRPSGGFSVVARLPLARVVRT